MTKMENPNKTATTTTATNQLPFSVIFILTLPAILIILLTVCGNLLVLFFKARVGRTNTTLLVWNLGLTDFLVGIFVLPVGAVYLIRRKWIFGRILCRIWVGADVTFCTCSVVTICVISADRYLAVTRPLRYKSTITKCKIIAAIVCIWAFSLAVLLSTVRWDLEFTQEAETCFAGHEIRYLAHSVVFAFFLPATVTLTLYWKIYRLARNRQKALDRGFLMILGRNMNFLTNTLTQTTALRVHVGKDNGMVLHQRRVLRTHERIAKTLGVVSCSFLFCWLPFFTLYLFNYQCEGCLPSLAIDVSSWLGYCNSMLNPIIYSFTVKEFKRSALSSILPAWNYAYRLCPKYISKPPSKKASQRIVRKKQQQISKLRANNNKNTWMPPSFAKRKVPPRGSGGGSRGAITSLMVNANCSITQNLLTAAAIDGARNEKGGEKKKMEISTKEIDMRSEMEKVEGKEKQRGKRLTIHESMDAVGRKIGETDFLNQNGLITATLLLATSKGTCTRPPASLNNSLETANMKRKIDDANSLPLSNYSESDESSPDPDRMFRMPCKMSIKRLKRHSLPDTSGMIKKKERMGSGIAKRNLFNQFDSKKDETRNSDVTARIPTAGFWQRATGRAIALRDQLLMGKSGSQNSLASRRRRRRMRTQSNVCIKKEEGVDEKEEKDGAGEKRFAVKTDTTTNAHGMCNNKEKFVGSLDEEQQKENKFEDVSSEAVKEDSARKMQNSDISVHIICMTDEIEL